MPSKIILLILFAVTTWAADPPPGCPISGNTPGYRLFTDPVNRFCLLYPAAYKPVLPAIDNRRFYARTHSKVIAQLDGPRMRNSRLDDHAPAAILFTLSNRAFDLQTFVAEAPTGYMTPPSPQNFGLHTFYYYGPGGGGVAYNDIYYFNLNGKTLRIVYDGPFDGHRKSPTVRTRQVEKIMLQSFRTFAP